MSISKNKFTKSGPELFDRGFHPIPIKQGSKSPALESWTTIPIDMPQVQRWANNGFAGCGTGIRCSTSIGAIDVDVTDNAASAAIYEWMVNELHNGKHLLNRVGKAPKFLVPCQLSGVTKKLVSDVYVDQEGQEQKIEILTAGQQFVAYGIHPDTGTEYTWRNGELMDVSSFKLPVFEEIELSGMLFDFFDTLAESLGWEKSKERKKDDKKKTSEETLEDMFSNHKNPSASLEDLQRAVMTLPQEICDDREDWIRVGAAIHFETRGSESGFKLFDRWSRLSDKYQGAKDTEARWKSFSLDKNGNNATTYGSILAYHNQLVTEETNETSETEELNKTDRDDSPIDCHKDELPQSSRNQGVTGAVWELIVSHTADFTIQMLYQDLDAKNYKMKHAIRVAVNRFEQKGLIEKKPLYRGVYRVLREDLEGMHPEFSIEPALPFDLPFDLHKIIKILPGRLIIVGGSTNAGKTLLGFEFLKCFTKEFVTNNDVTSQSVKSNHSLRSFSVSGCPLVFSGIRFLNSEMSAEELGYLLKCMGPKGMALAGHVQWVRRSCDFPRAVLKDGITIVDFLQIHKDFYEIGGTIAEMADKVGHGVLIVLIQKKSGEAAPRGGDFALERAGLAMMLDYAGPGISTLRLRKVKHPVDFRHNPQGMEMDFRISDDLSLEALTPFQRLSVRERKAINEVYDNREKERKAKEDFNPELF